MDRKKRFYRYRDKVQEIFPRLSELPDRDTRRKLDFVLRLWADGQDEEFVKRTVKLSETEVELFRSANCWPWVEGADNLA